jgi:hypothetical protein
LPGKKALAPDLNRNNISLVALKRRPEPRASAASLTIVDIARRERVAENDAEMLRHRVHARQHPRHDTARLSNRVRQRVDGRDHALGRVIVADGCLIEIDYDEVCRPRIDGLECVQPAAAGDDLADDLRRCRSGAAW